MINLMSANCESSGGPAIWHAEVWWQRRFHAARVYFRLSEKWRV